MDISTIADAVNGLAPLFLIRNASLFGSYARGDATEESDIDILISSDPGFSLFDAARFRRQLSDRLGSEVDIVSENALGGHFGANVQKEKVLLYERAWNRPRAR